MKKPPITVLMSVFNGMRFIRTAVESILNQTFTDFEFLIIDDGSTDQSVEIVRNFSDSRIRILGNTQNRGLAFSLNHGIREARGKFIARMDSDDLSLPHRLSTQLEYMDKNPSVAVCGSWIEQFGAGKSVWRPPSNHNEIFCRLLFGNSLAHSSVFMRADIFQQHGFGYDEKFTASQDYDLWSKIGKNYLLGNVPEVLVKYRVHKGQIRETKKIEQEQFADIVRKRFFAELGVDCSGNQEQRLKSLFSMDDIVEYQAALDGCGKFYKKLLIANRIKKLFDQKALKAELGRRWMMDCVRAEKKIGIRVWQIYRMHAPQIFPPYSWRSYCGLWARNFLFRHG